MKQAASDLYIRDRETALVTLKLVMHDERFTGYINRFTRYVFQQKLAYYLRRLNRILDSTEVALKKLMVNIDDAKARDPSVYCVTAVDPVTQEFIGTAFADTTMMKFCRDFGIAASFDPKGNCHDLKDCDEAHSLTDGH